MAKVHGGVAISMHALVQRINRAIDQDCQLKKTRGQRALFDLGEYYVLNTARNWIAEKECRRRGAWPQARMHQAL